MEVNPKIKQLIDEGVIGAETYQKRHQGGQICGMPVVGYRVWFPKDSEHPDIDIRIRNHRSQFQNRDTALLLLELVINP